MKNITHLTDIGFSKTVIDRFWKHVSKSTDDKCWEWSGARFVTGYGKIEKGTKPYGGELAHRVSWIINNGPIPKGKHVCHTCDNPPCCNPNHLWLGTMSQNIADKVAKGRGRWKTKLSTKDIAAIRSINGIFSQKKISNLFSISQSQVSRILSRKRWAVIHGWTE